MIYIYPNTVRELKKFILSKWPDKKVTSQCYSGMWHKYRYISVSVSPGKKDDKIFYKLSNGYVELHLAGDDYGLYRHIQNNLPSKYGEYQWHRYYTMTRGLLRIEHEVNTMEELCSAFEELISLVDPFVKQYRAHTVDDSTGSMEALAYGTYAGEMAPFAANDEMTPEVILDRMTLTAVLGKPLSIPGYQRTYCWPEKNVILLLDDILQNYNLSRSHSYHLGTLILQEKKGRFDIIDGQQRMITLGMILSFLGEQAGPLMEEKFNSKEAEKYIAYNKYLIRNYFEKLNFADSQKRDLAKSMLSNLCFDVLVLKDGSLDLAYTFFSSQNSKRGKPLTDYELLKSHHLRFIPNEQEEQQKHLASRWDDLLIKSERDNGDKRVSITLGMYLFNLRKWSRFETWDIHGDSIVKNEFEAANVIPEIPPFGEKFIYSEPVQGGTHFFTYTDFFIEKYKLFQKTEQYRILWETISCSGVLDFSGNGPSENKRRTHWWFGDVIATFLYAYYLKFGTAYLAEALTCITRIVSQMRYTTQKANKQSLADSARYTKLTFMIEHASSPTFFLANAMDVIKKIPSLTEEQRSYIRGDYLCYEKALYDKNAAYYSVDFSKAHNR